MKSKVILLCLGIVAPVFVNADVWPFYGHDILRTGQSPHVGPACCDIECVADIKETKSSPIIDGSGHVYIQGLDPGGGPWYLWCLNTSDCSINWKCQFGSGSAAAGIHSSCGISPVDGTIYAGYKSALFAVNPDSTLKWSYTTGGDIRSSPAVTSDGTIYVGCCDDFLYAINPDSSLKWKYMTGGMILSSPAIGSDGTIYVGSDDQRLYAINPDGTLRWSYTTGGRIQSSPAIGSDGTIYVGSQDNYLYAINPDSSLKWRYNTSGNVNSSPSVDNTRGMVYVGSDAGKICAIDTAGGLVWETRLFGAVGYSSPAVACPNDIVYIGDKNGKFYVIQGYNGHIICYNSHGYFITSPAIDEPVGTNYCVWYNAYHEPVYKICCSALGAEERSSYAEDRFRLHVYPNPFIKATRISFTLPANRHIRLEVYDTSGRLTKRLAERNYDAGEHTVEWNVEGMRRGIYFCKLRTETHVSVRKMILVRSAEE